MRAQGWHAANGLRFLVIFFVLGLPQTMRAQVKAAKPAANTPAQATQQNLNRGDDRVIINTDLIAFNVTITDQYGRFVTGLPKSAFTVLDDKQPQEITFFSDEDAPVSLGIVFDLTGSMNGDKVKRAREALDHFFETSREGDEYFLVTLQNRRANLALDRTRDSQAVLNKLTFVQSRGTTAFYDACYLGVDKVTHGTHPKRALLVISDGQDNNSRYTFKELRRLVKESDVIIYAIGIEEEGDGTPLKANRFSMILLGYLVAKLSSLRTPLKWTISSKVLLWNFAISTLLDTGHLTSTPTANGITSKSKSIRPAGCPIFLCAVATDTTHSF